MSYYQKPMGDYATGGYMGDPGFLGAVIGGIGKLFGKVRKIAKSPTGQIILGTAGGLAGGAAVSPAAPVPPGTMGGAVSFPGGTTISAAMTPGAPGAMTGGACPSGYHYAKDGSGRLVRNRRMNVANPRALRRSMRRVQGFEKLARRTISFTKRVRIKKPASR